MDVDSWTVVSRLLDEALELAPVDRARWIEDLAPEHEPIRRGCAACSWTEARRTATPFSTPSRKSIRQRNRLWMMQARTAPNRSRLGRIRCCASWEKAAWARSGWRSAPTGWSSGRWPSSSRGAAAPRSRADGAERPSPRDLNHPNIALCILWPTATGIIIRSIRAGAPIYDTPAESCPFAHSQLFLKWRAAVSHAHARLILHRDISPDVR